MRVLRSASGEGRNPCPVSLADMNRSTGVRPQADWIAGMGGLLSGFKDHQPASSERGQAAPSRIQTRSVSISAAESGFPPTGIWGGSPETILLMPLCSGAGETKAGPCLPPLRASSAVASERPLVRVWALWHDRHLRSRISSALSGVAARAIAPVAKISKAAQRIIPSLLYQIISGSSLSQRCNCPKNEIGYNWPNVDLWSPCMDTLQGAFIPGRKLLNRGSL